MIEQNISEQRRDSEYGNVLSSHSFQTVEDKILQSEIEEIVSTYNPKPNPYRINQINHNTERRE
jgi:hypothetical protein